MPYHLHVENQNTNTTKQIMINEEYFTDISETSNMERAIEQLNACKQNISSDWEEYINIDDVSERLKFIFSGFGRGSRTTSSIYELMTIRNNPPNF